MKITLGVSRVKGGCMWEEHSRQREILYKGSVQETERKLVCLEYRGTLVVRKDTAYMCIEQGHAGT